MTTQNRASEAQVKYLRDLARTHAVWGEAMNREETIACMEEMLALDLPATAATTLITQATRARRYPADQTPASDWEINRCRYNAAELAIYGLSVTVEETIARTEATINSAFFSSADARALMSLARRAQPHPTAQTPLRLSDIEGIDGLNVSEGHYAVFDEADVLRFYRIYTPISGSNQGEGVIRRFAGDNLLGLYPTEALLVLQAIDKDPDAAAYRFSDTFTRCWVCGKNLTDSVSRLLSVGPTCRGFANHSGLRVASGEVDHDPARREVFRALREWALQQGFTDPRNREERASATMTASRVASAWSGIPGVLGLSSTEAVEVVTAAMSNDISDDIKAGLLAAPKDTLLILIESGVLSADVMQILVEHPNTAVKNAANDFFLAQLGI
jgi:hypothetical protein